jgi:predicted transcriptional regulator
MALRRNPGHGGPIPKYNEYHIWKSLYHLNESGPIGRKRLAAMLGIGEGSTRSILNMLQENGLITINKTGVVMTTEGKECWRSAFMEVREIDLEGMTIGDADSIVRVPSMANKVTYGCEERDCAIRAGAAGATTLVCEGKDILFLGSKHAVGPEVELAIRSTVKVVDNDVLIIGTADDVESAEMGAVIAGLELLGGLRINRDLDVVFNERSTGSELISLAFAIHDLVGGLPVCAKSRDNLGIRIESGMVIDNAYTGAVLEEVIAVGTTIRKIATSGPYKGIKVIVTPIELDSRVIAAIGVVDVRSMAGVNNLIRLRSDE